MQHVAQLHAVERVVLPRCLVPRPEEHSTNETVDDYLEALEKSADQSAWSRFRVGDIITFESHDGYDRIITIIGIHASRREVGGFVDAMVYDGRPNYLMATFEELSKLRILRLDTMSLNDVAIYRSLLASDIIPPDAEEDVE